MPGSVLALGARRPDRRPERTRIWRRPERRGSGGTGGSPSTSVTFPTASLDARIYIALSADLSQPYTTWVWEDITRYVRFTPAVSVTNWRRDETSTVGPGAGQLVLDNRDGRFCRRNPNSPYYGMLSKNTPIWGTINAGSGVKTRLQQFVNEWPARWDKSGNDCYVPIRTAGILRRLGQGVVLKSPLRGTTAAANPTAYWPMEDGADASTLTSATGGSALMPLNTAYVDLAAADATVGSLPYVEFTASSNTAGGGIAPIGVADLSISATKFSVGLVMTGTMPSPTITTEWELFRFTTSAGSLCFAVAFCGTTGGVVGTNYGIDVWYQSVGGFSARAFSFATINPFDGNSHSLLCTWEQVGADVTVSMSLDGVAGTSDTETGQTLGSPATLTFMSPQILTFGDVGNNTGGRIGLGHFAVWGNVTPTDPYLASIGYDGELVHNRIKRVCAQEDIPYKATSASTTAMGPQPIAKALDVLRECETVDNGSLYEVDWGLGFQSTMDRYNATVGMTLDFNSGQIAEAPEPADDDQRTRNKVTASRPSGSEYTHEVTTGPMGTGSAGPGLYDDSVTVNVQTDAQLIQQASWRTLIGTVDVDRWPSIDMNLTAAPELIDTWTALGFGARINAINPPSQVAPETIDAFVEGYTERWDTRSWVASLNTSPASPYRVFRLAGPDDDTSSNLGYLVPTTCVLAEDLDTTETGVDITTTPLWSTTAADWTPGALITIEGEDMTVTAVSGAGNPQTLTVTRSVNSVVKTHPTGAAVTFKFPGFLAL